MTGRPSALPSWKSSAPQPGAMWTMPGALVLADLVPGDDPVLVAAVVERGRGRPAARRTAPVAPADELGARHLLLDRERAPQRGLERALAEPEHVLALADPDVAELRADGRRDVRGQRPGRRRPDEQRLAGPVDEREPDGEARVLAVLVALVHLHLGEAGAAARAPRHRVVALVQPAAPVALGEEAPDEVVVLVAEREVGAADLGQPEPPDEHLDGVGDRARAGPRSS